MGAISVCTPDAIRDTICDCEDAASETASAAQSPPIIEHELMSTPADQIPSFLDAHDGRMWQQDVIG